MILTEFESKELLSRYGIPTTRGSIAGSAPEAESIARKIGFPVVMKISSKDIPHKSDVGGVILNVKEGEVAAAYSRMIENVKKLVPSAMIDGVLVQQMAPAGLETIVGVKKDPQFGHAVMFGLGGIFVEVYKDVAFRVVPLLQNDAEAMISEIKAYQILKGMRGKKPYDIDAIRDVLLKVSDMCEKEDIIELDINPLIVYEKGVMAVDARVMLGT